ncbi:MAG: hypothetical protein IPN54_07350 [Bacteroidetes bacterium]|nr:hypothetical protein [Bacteroidota bacterium]
MEIQFTELPMEVYSKIQHLPPDFPSPEEERYAITAYPNPNQSTLSYQYLKNNSSSL